MSGELQTVAPQSLRTVQPTVLELPAEQMVARIASLANVLKDFVVKQGLSSKIQGRDYAHVDAWSFMGSMLGVLAKERAVDRLKDGSYLAFVDLVSISSGLVVGGASALCSVDEKRWGGADEFARRSMAITRATGKAYRLNFGWVMKMAGYEPTFEEDMPSGMERSVAKYDGRREDHKAQLRDELNGRDIQDPDTQRAIHKLMQGKPWEALEAMIAQAQAYGTAAPHADA